MAVKEYVFATTINDITQKLTDTRVASQLIAGGVGVAGQRKDGFLDCERLIDISRVPELKQTEKVSVNGIPHFKLGAALSLGQTAGLEETQSAFPLLRQALCESSDPARRNAYTLGGRLATKVPVGMLFPALSALRAQVEIQSGGSSALVPVSQWLTTYFAEDAYLITAVLLPITPAPEYAMLDVKRRNYPGEIVAGALAACGADRCDVRVYGSVDNYGLVPFDDTAQYLNENGITPQTVAQVEDLAALRLKNLWGADEDAQYRKRVLAALVVRCVNTLFL